MSKIAKKFMFSIAAVLAAVICLSLYLNSNFIERYYLYKEKQDMNRICGELAAEDAGFKEKTALIEEKEDVVVVRTESTSDNNVLNARLRDAFLGRGLGFEKYWLWEEDQARALAGERVLKLYQQEKLHYSLLIEYISVNGEFIAVAKIVPAVSRTIALINGVTAAVFFAAFILMLVIIAFLVKRITTPLAEIGETARAIAGQDFRRIELHTGDELELLAADINEMSEKLQRSQRELNEKNRQMESLLSSVSHDLKTPITLVKAYARGIQDGMDDGTFVDTILSQNGKMEQMVLGLLDLSRMENGEYKTERLDLSGIIKEETKAWTSKGSGCRAEIISDIEPGIELEAGVREVRSIVENLLSNAVKYTADGRVSVTFYMDRETGHPQMRVTNAVCAPDEMDPDRLWEPFYVAEQSRNKELSGTGLGLSIVRAAVKRCGFECFCRLDNGAITFTVIF